MTEPTPTVSDDNHGGGGPPVEFDCIECGVHVFAIGAIVVPEPPLCAVCGWAREFIPDPVERAKLHARLIEGTIDDRS
jgi:hypothetical protein